LPAATMSRRVPFHAFRQAEDTAAKMANPCHLKTLLQGLMPGTLAGSESPVSPQTSAGRPSARRTSSGPACLIRTLRMPTSPVVASRAYPHGN
jgi:hypothetical protein